MIVVGRKCDRNRQTVSQVKLVCGKRKGKYKLEKTSPYFEDIIIPFVRGQTDTCSAKMFYTENLTDIVIIQHCFQKCDTRTAAWCYAKKCRNIYFSIIRI